jgi:hypothetical protein
MTRLSSLNPLMKNISSFRWRSCPDGYRWITDSNLSSSQILQPKSKREQATYPLAEAVTVFQAFHQAAEQPVERFLQIAKEFGPLFPMWNETATDQETRISESLEKVGIEILEFQQITRKQLTPQLAETQSDWKLLSGVVQTGIRSLIIDAQGEPAHPEHRTELRDLVCRLIGSTNHFEYLPSNELTLVPHHLASGILVLLLQVLTSETNFGLCGMCGDLFEVRLKKKNQIQKFCSDACRLRAHQHQKRQLMVSRVLSKSLEEVMQNLKNDSSPMIVIESSETAEENLSTDMTDSVEPGEPTIREQVKIAIPVAEEMYLEEAIAETSTEEEEKIRLKIRS